MKKTIAKLAVSLLLALTVLTPLAGSSKVPYGSLYIYSFKFTYSGYVTKN